MRTISNGGFQTGRSLSLLIVPLTFAMTAVAAGPPPVKSTGPVVSDIIIRDNLHVSCDTIENQMKTRVGRVFDEATLQGDIRALYATRQFANVYAEKFEDGPGRVKVVVTIRDYPSVIEKITFIGGGKVKASDLEDIARLRKGMPCNPTANKVACLNIVRHYRKDGYPQAHCDLVKGGKLGDTEVKFEIAVGEPTPK